LFHVWLSPPSELLLVDTVPLAGALCSGAATIPLRFKSVDKPEENVLPRIPRQKSEDDTAACFDDLSRHSHEHVKEGSVPSASMHEIVGAAE
jgi:hypothetical protein